MPQRLLAGAAGTLKDPLCWAGALLFTAFEVGSLYAGDAPAVGVPFAQEVLPELISLGFYALAFAAAAQLRGALVRVGACVLLGVLGACGMAPGLVAAAAPVPVWADCAATVLAQLAFTGLMIVFLLRLSTRSLLSVKRIVVGSGVLNGALVGASAVAPALCAVVFTMMGAGALALSCRRAPEAIGCVGGSAHRRSLRFPVVLALGLLLVAVSFSFLQSLLYQQPEDVVIPVVAGTKLVAAVLFGAVLQWMSDTGYATLAKLIITLAAGAFLVFLAQGSYSALPSTLMATGYSLLELTSLLLLADLASYARWNPVRLICAYYFIDTLGYVLGCLLLGQTLALGPAETRLAAAALSLLLLVCAVWVFNEKRVNDFTWAAAPDAAPNPSVRDNSKTTVEDTPFPESNAEEAMEGIADLNRAAAADAPPLAFTDKVTLLAERYHLTERETEVMELFAAGRSAAFIAELQFVTINTVRSHIKHIYGKCDVHSRQELITLIEQQTLRDAAL